MPFQFSNTPVYVSEGQTVRFKYKAPSTWDTTQSVTIQIGLQQTIWYITTIPEDFAPDPFPFTPLENADLDTMYVYGDGSRPGEAIITVSGLTPNTEASVSVIGSLEGFVENFSVRIKRVSLGQTEFGDWVLPIGDYQVANTDEIQLRLKSNTLQGLDTYADVTVGARTERWTITTEVTPPNIPVPFPDFDDITNARLGINVYSEILIIQGLNDPALISIDNPDCHIAISNTNTTFTNADGYDVLSGVTFVTSADLPVITNGQYVQLYVVTENTAGATTTNVISIGDKENGSVWSVTTGNFPSTTPTTFTFVDQSDVLEDAMIASAPAPILGISGLGTGVEVDVVLVSTTGTEPRIKIQYAEGGESSIGLFPTKVNNGDKIVLYNRSSATFGQEVQTTIRVGQREILPWRIVTNLGPDTDAVFSPPSNLTNRAPSTEYISGIVTVTGINRPIQITATNGALISIDFDTPSASPRTFTPGINTSFRLVLTSDSNLSGTKTTTVTVGTGTSNNPFAWTISNYAVAPPPPEYRGSWYSKRNAFVDDDGNIRQDKQDGYAVGTIVTILKQPDGTYGDLEGQLSSKLDARFPGYLECDGSTYNCADFPDLFEVIENTYGGSGTYDSVNRIYTGTFNVPDLRNRKLAGTGVVDGNRASSAFLPVDGGVGVFEPGGIGGWWYVDDVDVAGDNPYEQIIGEAGASSGTSSNFFNLGTVKTVFNAPIQVDVNYTITGSVTGLVGPLLDTLVNVPVHSHLYVSAVVDGTTGDPLIPWGTPALAPVSSNPSGFGIGSSYFNQPGSTEDDAARNNTGDVADQYLAKLATYSPNFETQWNAIDGVDNLRAIVRDMISRANTTNYSGGAGGDGEASDQEIEVITAETWWPSPYNAVPDSYFFTLNSSTLGGDYGNTGGSGIALRVLGVIDTEPVSIRLDPYTPPIIDGDDNTVESHSHLISIQSITDPQAEYSYGNVGGWGSAKVGLSAAATTVNVTFNQSDVGLELNPGTFTLNTSVKKPVPNVAFAPNRKVPLLPEFHKVKFLIKAF